MNILIPKAILFIDGGFACISEEEDENSDRLWPRLDAPHVQAQIAKKGT